MKQAKTSQITRILFSECERDITSHAVADKHGAPGPLPTSREGGSHQPTSLRVEDAIAICVLHIVNMQRRLRIENMLDYFCHSFHTHVINHFRCTTPGEIGDNEFESL